MFQKSAVYAQVIKNPYKKDHCQRNHQPFRGQRQAQMDILAADDNGERGGDGNQIHGHVRVEKKDIQSHCGNRNQRNRLNFSDYGEAVGQHKDQGDYKAYNLPFIVLVRLLLNLFCQVCFQSFQSLEEQSGSE